VRTANASGLLDIFLPKEHTCPKGAHQTPADKRRELVWGDAGAGPNRFEIAVC
jgi:hypothetical protein